MTFPRCVDILDQLSALTDGGADYSIDATGAAPCIKNAWEVRDNLIWYEQADSVLTTALFVPVSGSFRKDGAILGVMPSA
jgi:hypothetical protein